VIRAAIYDEKDRCVAQGLAEEKADSSFINRTSYVENCETSAWGRALANLGIGIGADITICSAEEVAEAIINQGRLRKEDKKARQQPQPKQETREKQSGPTQPSNLAQQQATVNKKIDDAKLNALRKTFAEYNAVRSSKNTEEQASAKYKHKSFDEFDIYEYKDIMDRLGKEIDKYRSAVK